MNYIQKIFLGFFSVITIFALSGCSKDKDNYVVNVDTKEISLTTTNKSKELKITSTGEWHFEAQGLQGGFGINQGSTDWYTVTPMYGENNQTVTITLAEGITSDKATTLKVVGKHNTETISLKFTAQ